MEARNETRKPTATTNGENGGAGALAGCVNDRDGETLFVVCRYSGENADGLPDEVATCRNLYAARGWAKETVEHAARYGKAATVRIFRAELVECVSAMDAPETEGGAL